MRVGSVITRMAKAGLWLYATYPLTSQTVERISFQSREPVVGIIRTLPLPDTAITTDISSFELDRITDAGLDLMLCQRVRRPGWRAKLSSAPSDASCAATHALHVGYSRGAHLWQSIEYAAATSFEAIEYSDYWAKSIKSMFYSPGLRVGKGSQMTPSHLSGLPHNSFWERSGKTVEVDVCGYALHSGGTMVVAGLEFEAVHVATDLMSRLPMVMAQDIAAPI